MPSIWFDDTVSSTVINDQQRSLKHRNIKEAMGILILVLYYCFGSNSILFFNRYKSGYNLLHAALTGWNYYAIPISLDLPLCFPFLFVRIRQLNKYYSRTLLS